MIFTCHPLPVQENFCWIQKTAIVASSNNNNLIFCLLVCNSCRSMDISAHQQIWTRCEFLLCMVEIPSLVSVRIGICLASSYDWYRWVDGSYGMKKNWYRQLWPFSRAAVFIDNFRALQYGVFILIIASKDVKSIIVNNSSSINPPVYGGFQLEFGSISR